MLAPRLLRVERSANGQFEDAATQIVWRRDFCTEEANYFTVEGKGSVSVLSQTNSGELCFRVDTSTGRVRSITLADGRTVSNYKKGNLKGTRRTLDFTFGKVKIDDGMASRGGVAVLDDSNSLLLSEDKETILPREHAESDCYYFAYGSDYRGCLQDFYRLTGEVPMIPRFALGNWWSRYKAYTQREYMELMERFERENIPITVATVDMDWHWVDLARFGALTQNEKGRPFQGSGWTGYSWNTDLFPDYKQFLSDLHAKGYHVPLNLHPADGVRAFETQYEAMAKAMGVDPASKQPIEFDLTDPKFRKAYFEVLHHPFERDGVDFWWIDWQQGKSSKLPGLDPLWALNHYHYRDNGLILSRYAGPGSHRYPLGFSGDTAINWRVLKFQTYFTATAANAGYGWWSHDIGGHHYGKKDDELYIRWLQYGVFNPINRLHSTSNEFAGKEPWKAGDEANRLAGDFLRLRHRLIPYLYSMAHRAHAEGAALCEPLYYQYPNEKGAYAHQGNYFFGSELLAAPIVGRRSPATLRAAANVWLPAGRWTDIFTGQVYEGGREYKVYRGVESIPVFAKAGAILPMGPPCENANNDTTPPGTLYLDVWRGNNTFTLYEDEGETTFAVKEEGGDLLFTISGNQLRNYVITFKDIDAQPVLLQQTDTAEIRLQHIRPAPRPTQRERLIALISSFQLGTNLKKRAYTQWLEQPDAAHIPGPRRCRGAIREVLETA
jgi:alpha-glucosidase (family GH31 glycosyl hydrolase)